jgi:hypothetical protein
MSSDLVCHMAILGILLISDSRTRWTFGTFDFQVSSMPPSSQTRSLPGFVEPPGSLVVCSMRMVLGRSRTVLDIQHSGGSRIFRRDGPLSSTFSRHGSLSLLVSAWTSEFLAPPVPPDTLSPLGFLSFAALLMPLKTRTF